MSRQTRVAATVKEAMNVNEDDFISDEEDYDDEDFTNEEFDIIDDFIDLYRVTESEAVHFLKINDFNIQKAGEELLVQRQKEKFKLEKQKEKEEKKKIRQEKKAEAEVEALKLKEKKSSDLPRRKSSTDSPRLSSLNPRKNSNVVEDYETDHYNMDYPSLEVDSKVEPSKTLNIVVVGHVDSGKSTLVGMFLHEINFLSKKEIHKNQKESKEMGKESFKYAWVTDQTEEERVRGVTIDVGVKKINFHGRQIVFLDSPGHRDFIPNMITGAAQADYAVLVVDVTHFDSSFINGGQTKEHAYIVKSLGVHKLIVAMNKMDLIEWDGHKFEVIKKKFHYYLQHIGFTDEQIVWVPVSAVTGANVTRSLQKPFESQNVVYSKSIADVIRELDLPVRPINKPLRISITNFYESEQGKLKGHCISGKIEGGMLTKDSKLVILPQNSQCVVKDILKNDEKVRSAIVGDNVEILIKLIDETYFQTIKYGNVLSSLKYSIPVAKKFVIEALALDLDVPILKGTQIVIYIGANKTEAVITKFNFIFNPSNGTILKKNPKMLRSNDCAEIEIQTKQKVCVELFSNYKVFGRVIIREKKDTLCVGTVKKIK